MFFLQGNRHSLTVLSVEEGHLGVYACHAANAYGADSKKIEVSGDDDDDRVNDNVNDNDEEADPQKPSELPCKHDPHPHWRQIQPANHFNVYQINHKISAS